MNMDALWSPIWLGGDALNPLSPLINPDDGLLDFSDIPLDALSPGALQDNPIEACPQLQTTVAENATPQQDQHAVLPVSASRAAFDDPRVTCNNKTLLDSRWPIALLSMNVVEMNRYLRFHPMSEADTREFKAARRRHLSRGYSKTLRDKRRQRRQAGDSTSVSGNDNDQDDQDEFVRELQTANAALALQVSALKSQISGLQTLLAKVQDEVAKRGIVLPASLSVRLE